MPDMKSYAEFIKGTYHAMLKDMACRYPELTKEFSRDKKRLDSAIDSHGIRFALDTMVSFAKHFDQCLARKRLIHSNLLHFGVDKRGGTIPRLFRGLVLRVFDRSGALKHCPDINAIRDLRQLLRVVKRLRIASNVRDRCEAVQDFFKTDSEVKNGCLSWADHSSFDSEHASRFSFTDYLGRESGSQDDQLSLLGEIDDHTPDVALPYGLLEKVQQVADLITGTLGQFNPEEWRLKHGPGAVSDQRYEANKYSFPQWPERLESVFPYDMFATANVAQLNMETNDGSRPVTWLSHESPAKLHAVPKTIATPRLIAAEPHYLQWCQQGILAYFYRRASVCFVNRFVDFRRQDVNGALALSASKDGRHATIDLSAASDRISCWVVERLFRRNAALLDALQATRSVWIKQDIDRMLPKFSRIRKFSTMGNACTFPVQSLLFLSMALGTLTYVRKLKVNYETMRLLGMYEVRVFGDDIVIPNDCFGQLTDLLKAFGLKVNQSKTFSEGNFRESCGVDAFDGQDVTAVSILDVPSRARPGSIASSVDVHNNLITRGYEHTSTYVRKTVERFYKQIRTVRHGSGLFGWSDLLGSVDTVPLPRRWNARLHRSEVRCLTITARQQRLLPEDSSGLLQFFTEARKIVLDSKSAIGHLAQRPKSKLRLGWVPAYYTEHHE